MTNRDGWVYLTTAQEYLLVVDSDDQYFGPWYEVVNLTSGAVEYYSSDYLDNFLAGCHLIRRVV